MRLVEIQQRLNEISNLPLESHAEAMKILKLERCPELICSLDLKRFNDPPLRDYDCHLYSLGLFLDNQNLSIYQDIFKEPGINIFKILEHKNILMELNPEEIRPGDIIVYRTFSKQGGFTQIRHSGLVYDSANKIMISKWGKGHRWIHAIDHVPNIYVDGYQSDQIYYRMVEKEKIRNEILNYAQ